MPGPYADDRGTYFLVLGWVLTSLAVVAIAIRLYTRLFLTRSAGSDDLFIAFTSILTVAGEIGDSIAVAHGLGRHQEYLDNSQVASIVKWEYIDLIIVFWSLFFLRASIMLFTLRLLPVTKIWPQRVIAVAFFLNFAITMIVIVTYGVKCIPFEAIYKNIPDATCAPQNTLVITQQLNGVLACIIDIVTALIPAFLLWRIRIKRSTKIILDTVFLLGLVTAALSIGRAATTNTGIWEEDTSWRIQPPNTFSMVEEKLGIVFACCPAIRQGVVYVLRTKSVLPHRRQQERPEADFVRMRRKIKLRDLFWYRKAQSHQLQTFTGKPIYPPERNIDTETRGQAQKEAQKSPLDAWKFALAAVFGRRKVNVEQAENGAKPPEKEIPSHPNRSFSLFTTRQSSPSARDGDRDNEISWPGLREDSERDRITRKYREWHIPTDSPQPDQASEATPSTPSYLRGTTVADSEGSTRNLMNDGTSNPSNPSSNSGRGARGRASPRGYFRQAQNARTSPSNFSRRTPETPQPQHQSAQQVSQLRAQNSNRPEG